ncbi:MAG: hypothetical protein PHW27_12965 [Melioribacteraceae bacterium]|nr:hypothetical protein [Melioribacteraceae bacterium]MDD3559470.1 hypothetical protein [Melioribacteraceae bacterium]
MYISKIISFAFRCGLSFVGGRPAQSVLNGYLGELVFFFQPHHFGNYFFQWVRINFDSQDYTETELKYKGKSYTVIFLKIPQKIDKKFLFAFKQFSKRHSHLVNYF